ncbi:MAG: PilZ domain-containing protein [Spirochaetales bacterium]|jgi:c-di-GMP-binding flagellar brake protein YcgR|nr:PilZ domain-containing protein [Spirochaetales bacterium]
MLNFALTGPRIILAAELTPMINSGGPQAVIGFSIGLGAVILLIFLGSLSSRRSAKTRISSAPAKVKKVSLKRQGEALGLSKTHIEAIENILERNPGINRNLALSNPAILDKILQAGMEEIEEQGASEPVKEKEKLILFQIKQIVERNSRTPAGIKGSRNFSPGLKLVLSTEAKVRLSTRILSVLKEGLALEIPRDSKTGAPVKLHKGMNLAVFYWKANGQGFSFPSKALGYVRTRGIDALLIKHSSTVTEATQRRFRRKALQRPCYFYPVRIVTLGTGKAQEKKAMIEGQRGTLGTVLEVSSGGCSIKTSAPLARGELIKVDFETEKKNSISAYGKVVNYSKESIGGTMHIQFTRVSQQSVNRINSFIYGL